jgi:hypothetical protein
MRRPVAPLARASPRRAIRRKVEGRKLDIANSFVEEPRCLQTPGWASIKPEVIEPSR